MRKPLYIGSAIFSFLFAMACVSYADRPFARGGKQLGSRSISPAPTRGTAHTAPRNTSRHSFQRFHSDESRSKASSASRQTNTSKIQSGTVQGGHGNSGKRGSGMSSRKQIEIQERRSSGQRFPKTPAPPKQSFQQFMSTPGKGQRVPLMGSKKISNSEEGIDMLHPPSKPPNGKGFLGSDSSDRKLDPIDTSKGFDNFLSPPTNSGIEHEIDSELEWQQITGGK